MCLKEHWPLDSCKGDMQNSDKTQRKGGAWSVYICLASSGILALSKKWENVLIYFRY